MSNIDCDTEAYSCLLKISKLHHPAIYSLLKRNGNISFSPSKETSVFIFLCRTIIGQQLSLKVSKTIWAKVSEQIAVSKKPHNLFFSPENEALIRKCGVSRNKVKAIFSLIESRIHTREAETYLEKLNYPELITEITKIWGVGKWTADMLAIFYFQMPDILPTTDVTISKGLAKLGIGYKDSEQLDVYSPWRTFISLHLWYGEDNKNI